jgi:hypothetical protein
MNTLMIKDLSITEQLDSKAMSAVRGGNGFGPSSSYFNFTPMYAPNNSKTLNIENATGNNAAFVAGVTTTIDPHLNSSNNIYVS